MESTLIPLYHDRDGTAAPCGQPAFLTVRRLAPDDALTTTVLRGIHGEPLTPGDRMACGSCGADLHGPELAYREPEA
jgi:hypothetical protein